MHSKSWIFGSSEIKQPIAFGKLHPQTLLQRSTIGKTLLLNYPIPRTIANIAVNKSLTGLMYTDNADKYYSYRESSTLKSMQSQFTKVILTT